MQQDSFMLQALHNWVTRPAGEILPALTNLEARYGACVSE
jgi:hypothetical protein